MKQQDSVSLQSKVLSTGDRLNITPYYQAGVLKGDLALKKGSSIAFEPLGNEYLVYTLQRHEAGYRLTSNRTLDVEGEKSYQETFTHEVSLDMPDTEIFQFTAIIDRCSSELLLQDGEFCVTDLSYSAEVSGFNLRCIEGEATIVSLGFVSEDNL